MDCSKRSAGAVASLPDDPLVEILSRVPVKSLCRFKCVSKAWRDLIADPLHRKKLPQTLEGFFFLADSCGDDSGSDDGGGEDGGSDGGGGDSGGDAGDGEDSGSDGGDDDEFCGDDSGSDDSGSDDGGGEDGGSDGGGCDSCGDAGDGEDSGSDGGDDDKLERQAYWYFADALGRSVRHVGRRLPFLAEVRVPGIEDIELLHHCNGLLLFGYIRKSDESLSYIVSNPATQQWVALPSSDGKQSTLACPYELLSSLIFDPAASPNFHLIQIKDGEEIPVQVYSSKSGVWIPVGREWRSGHIAPGPCGAYVNGMLYVAVYGGIDGDGIVEMDVEGNTRKTIPLPFLDEDDLDDDLDDFMTNYVGLSQGRLPCIYRDDQKLFIWVLEDFETQKWVLKDTVSFLHLFGKDYCSWYKVIAIHPDHSLVYIWLSIWHNRKLISYNMDSKEVCHLFTLEHGDRCITP